MTIEEAITKMLTKAVNDVKTQGNVLSNYQFPEKCKYCGYYFNFLCRADRCQKGES